MTESQKSSGGSIEGVGADVPTVTNAAGGKQSASPYRSDLLPPFAMLRLAKILAEGSKKYGDNNWHKITIADNINHAMTHLLAYLAGDSQDDHLGHAACRVVFALDQLASGREAGFKVVKEGAVDKYLADRMKNATTTQFRRWIDDGKNAALELEARRKEGGRQDESFLFQLEQAVRWGEVASKEYARLVTSSAEKLSEDTPSKAPKKPTPKSYKEILAEMMTQPIKLMYGPGGFVTKAFPQYDPCPDCAKIPGEVKAAKDTELEFWVGVGREAAQTLNKGNVDTPQRYHVLLHQEERGKQAAAEIQRRKLMDLRSVPGNAATPTPPTAKALYHPKRHYRVYISGPISKPETTDGIIANARNGDDAHLALLKVGLAPFNPMLSIWAGGARKDADGNAIAVSCRNKSDDNRGFLNVGWQDWINADLPWVEVAHAVLRLPGESSGADRECEHAKSVGIPVFHSVEAVCEFFRNVDNTEAPAEDEFPG